MSWVPRGDGKGGVFSNATYHDMPPDSTQNVVQAVVDHNSWRARLNDVQYGATTGTGFATSIEIFNKYVGVGQSLTSSVVAGFTQISGQTYVNNMTTTQTIRASGTPMPLGTGGGTMCFSSVNNRLYMANGTDPPAITAD